MRKILFCLLALCVIVGISTAQWDKFELIMKGVRVTTKWVVVNSTFAVQLLAANHNRVDYSMYHTNTTYDLNISSYGVLATFGYPVQGKIHYSSDGYYIGTKYGIMGYGADSTTVKIIEYLKK